jgi:hypothetical protein
MAAQNMIQVAFLHPRDSREFKAEIGPATTGAQAVEGLVKANFIEASGLQRAYGLQHQKTGKSLPPGSALVASGVSDGDAVAVVENSSGASE